jgi:hypothetical protein
MPPVEVELRLFKIMVAVFDLNHGPALGVLVELSSASYEASPS